MRLPVVDGFQLAAAGGRLRGSCPLAALQRLQQALHSNAGKLEYEVRGLHDAEDRPALQLRITGALELICQRCLGALSFTLDIDSMLVLAKRQEEIDSGSDDPDSSDFVVGGKAMPVAEMLEDEVLLALPYAPRHECCSAGGAGVGDAKALPFARLRGLLDRGERKKS